MNEFTLALGIIALAVALVSHEELTSKIRVLEANITELYRCEMEVNKRIGDMKNEVIANSSKYADRAADAAGSTGTGDSAGSTSA